MGTIALQAKTFFVYKNIKGQNPYLNPKVTLSLNKTSTMPIFVVFDVKVESVG